MKDVRLEDKKKNNTVKQRIKKAPFFRLTSFIEECMGNTVIGWLQAMVGFTILMGAT